MMKCRHETPCSRRCLYTEEIKQCCGYSNCKHFQPNYTTNADRIRAMSDEELADEFMRFVAEVLNANVIEGWRFSDEFRDYLLKDLRQPVKDGENG